MAFFHDLTPYTYLKSAKDYGIALNVGWLSGGQPYAHGNVSEEFLNNLWLHCKVPVHTTRGLSPCEISQECVYPVVAEFNMESLRLGSAEIRVLAREGTIFAAPDMIFHYITVHRYLPPNKFLDAVINGYLPHSSEYLIAKAKFCW
jgi:hypothetical protein